MVRRGTGPAPDMTALNRERDFKTFTRLPKECTRPTPDWPIEVPDPSLAELSMWARMWTMPQAHVWHADRLYDAVALYVRQFVEAAKPRASSQLRINVRMAAETLLLSTGSMNAARYIIVESAEDQILKQIEVERHSATGTDGRASRGARRTGGARSRMTVVGGTGPAPAGSDDEGAVDDPDA